MRILLLEPFMGESHRAWAEGLARHSGHEIEVWGLPGRHWKWRMHGAAETFAARFEAERPKADLILASDMLDVAAFLAHTRRLTAHVPVAVYFHENQFAYPWSPGDPDPRLQRDHHYAYLNYRSALVADHAFFNSQYNLDSFLDGLGRLLPAFPDHQELSNIARIRAKSSVLPLGMDLPPLPPRTEPTGPPCIVWNHRWEYDKGPQPFFEALMALAGEEIDFRLAVLGRSYQKAPAIFEQAREALAPRIVHWGFLPGRAAYWEVLRRGTLLPVTAIQDFFGASVVEAMHAGVTPLLPDALAYPSHVPAEWREQLLYADAGDFKAKLRRLLMHPVAPNPSEWVRHYAWESCIASYDAALAGVSRA